MMRPRYCIKNVQNPQLPATLFLTVAEPKLDSHGHSRACEQGKKSHVIERFHLDGLSGLQTKIPHLMSCTVVQSIRGRGSVVPHIRLSPAKQGEEGGIRGNEETVGLSPLLCFQ